MAIGVAIAICALLLPSAAPATGLAGELVRASTATTRACTAGELEGPGIVRVELTAPALGALRATLSGGRGDWDLAAFSAGGGAVVAGSASTGPDEVAGGYAFAGERLVVQACRRPGASGSVRLDVDLEPIERERPAPAPSLLRVPLPGQADRAALQESGLDVAEGGAAGYAQVVSHGPADERLLARLGLPYVTVDEDLTAAARERRGSALLPSGRASSYRRLFDYSEEMKALAAAHPSLVRTITLPRPTYEGRPVEGIEITRNVRRTDDGKPVFVQLGLHHAREWPSGELSLEWAYELLDAYSDGDPRARRIVRRSRTVIVPVVNPDGFNASREAGELEGAAAGRGGDSSGDAINIVSHPIEYRRKNCRLADGSEGGSCLQPPDAGVDLNRNYGGLWGGPGAGVDPLAADYRGPAPFSEPEASNVRDLFSTRQVTAFVTNHTFGDLILRPPGLASAPDPADEPLLARLGRRMAARTGYASQPGYQLYATSGTTEDWAYYATGSLGYTFEIGTTGFHPPFAETVAEWTGNRDAYYELATAAAKRSSHALVRGRGPRGGTIVASKHFATLTSPVLDAAGRSGAVLRLRDELTSSDRIDRRGRFALHLNPSTRPIAAEAGASERWTLTCRGRSGRALGSRRIRLGRGDVEAVDLRGRCGG